MKITHFILLIFIIGCKSNLVNNKAKPLKIADPTLSEIIQAFEQKITYYKTVNKEEVLTARGLDKAAIESISEQEFNKMFRQGNTYLYENMITSLKEDKAEFKVVSRQDNKYGIIFNEKENKSLEVHFTFKRTDTGWLVE